MTVALLGLLLALVSVMQMAKSQEQLIRDNFSIIEINQQLRQTLGNHLIVMLTDDNRSEALARCARASSRPWSAASQRPTTMSTARPSVQSPAPMPPSCSRSKPAAIRT